MPGLLSKRRPYPHHITINGPGYMLVPNEQTGLLYEKKAVTGDDVSPTVFDYGSYDPFTEKPHVVGRLVGGMGEAVQRTATATRYKGCKNVDRSIGGMARLGPFFDAQSLPSTFPHDVTQFLAAANLWWAFGDRYVWRRDSPTTWALDQDFGALAYVRQATTYAPPGGTFGQIYAAAGEKLWNWNGLGTWTQCLLPAPMNAFFVERSGDELYIADSTNVVRLSTADPLTGPGAWGGPIYVGDASAPITGLRSLGGQIFVFKTDGVYTLNADGSTNDLFPEFRETGKRSTNGTALGVYANLLWFRFGDGYYYLSGGGAADLVPVGPERLLEDTGVRGVPVAFVGHDPWFGYLAVHDAATNTSSVLKYGTWMPAETGSVPGYQFAEVWHGAIKQWVGKQVQALGVEGPITTTVDPDFPYRPNPWLWVGFADGTVEYTPLPVGSPDPARDPGCRFTTDEAYTDWPDQTAFAEADTKHWRTFVPMGTRLDTSNYARIGYRTDPAAPFALLPTDLTRSGLRVSTPGAGVSSVTLQVREYLVGTRTSTPELEAVTLLAQVRPAMLKRYTATVRAARNVPRRDGLADRRTGEQIRAALAAVADGSQAPGSGPVPVIFPDETSEQIDVVDYSARQDASGYGLSWNVGLTMVGFQTNTVYGTWDRAAGHDWDEVAAYSWEEAGSW